MSLFRIWQRLLLYGVVYVYSCARFALDLCSVGIGIGIDNACPSFFSGVQSLSM